MAWGLDDEGGWVIRGEDGLRGAWMTRGAHSRPQGNKVPPPLPHPKKKDSTIFNPKWLILAPPPFRWCWVGGWVRFGGDVGGGKAGLSEGGWMMTRGAHS